MKRSLFYLAVYKVRSFSEIVDEMKRHGIVD